MKEKYAMGEQLYMKERQLDLLDKLADNAADAATFKTVLESYTPAPTPAAPSPATEVEKPTALPQNDEVEVFISFKNTYNDNPTPDSVIAAQVFEKLSSMGYRVFMMNETLYQKGVSNYKKIIDEALEEASCLIVIASCREFVESEWVRYEWDTYLTEVLAGRKAGDNIFTLRADGTDISALPISLRKYQSFPVCEADQLYMWVSHALSGTDHGKKQKPRLVYPACFTANVANGGWDITFPDLTIKDTAPGLKEAFDKAKSLLEVFAAYVHKCHEIPPEPSELEAVADRHPESRVMYVDAYLPVTEEQ
jgi:hypothetical protein